MKRPVVLLIIICQMLCLFSGCGRKFKQDDIIDVVCTTFPIYDWVMNVVGENNPNISVKLLLDNGVDMHSFQPGAKEIATVSSCDVLIYVGGESDTWIEDAIKESINREQKQISLIELLGDRAKEEDELNFPGGNETHSSKEHNQEKLENEIEYDEHVWLSIDNAIYFTDAFSDLFASLDKENQESYKENAKAYTGKLSFLDENVRESLKQAKNNSIIVADRFPFRYLVDDYNIKYYAAFPGCSAETEASFEVVIYLSEKLDETGLNYVIVTESSDNKIAETVIDNTKDKNKEIITMDSIQTITLEDYRNGITYYNLMEANLNSLVKVLE